MTVAHSKGPVVQAVLVHLSEPDRDMDEGIPIPAAGLEQQHARARVLAQTIREDATGRAGADDHVIVGHALMHPRSPLPSCPIRRQLFKDEVVLRGCLLDPPHVSLGRIFTFIMRK